MEIINNNTKKKMFELSIKTIRESGVKSLSLRKISKESNLTTGAFYKNFKNKSDLLNLVTEYLSAKVYQEFIEILSKKNIDRPQDKLVMLGIFLTTKFRDDYNVMNFLFFNDTSTIFLKKGKDKYELLNLTKKLISEVVEEQKLNLDTEELFVQIWSFIQGYSYLIKSHVLDADSDLLGKTLNKLLRGN